MIEFERADTRTPIVLNTDSIADFTSAAGASDRCVIVLRDGRQVVAAASFADIRRLTIQSRSGFATLVGQ